MTRAPIEVFVDGDCPLCSREVDWLRRLDQQGELRFTDISAPDFDPTPTGASLEQLMRRIHARLPTGETLTGVEVFREIYARVGFARAVAVSRWPLISQLLDGAYVLFAKSRLRLTGRCALPSSHNVSTSQLGPNQAG